MLVNPTREELESNCSERGASCWCRVRTRESFFAGATLRLRILKLARVELDGLPGGTTSPPGTPAAPS